MDEELAGKADGLLGNWWASVADPFISDISQTDGILGTRHNEHVKNVKERTF